MGAHRWRRGLKDVGDQALIRGLLPHFRECVRGCPDLTAGVVTMDGHKASDGHSPAVAPSPPVREMQWSISAASSRLGLPCNRPHEANEFSCNRGTNNRGFLSARAQRAVTGAVSRVCAFQAISRTLGGAASMR